ncbi:hypothetical protein ABZ848_03695 [Streptomyces sp. NPDC047081]|uniref:hypothetical protein n=1 Tax=Streptomyces sp. NPDC047081 TaxID=3154706 RepID=UPI003409D610
MRWSLRRFETVTCWSVVAVWAAVWTGAVVTADPLPAADSAVGFLVVPSLLWAAAARMVVRHWWSATGSRLAELDPPGRVLALAVAVLPERRREWGRAMTAELAEVEGESERRRFALSSARAALWPPPAGGRPLTGLVIAAVVAVTAVTGPAVGAAVPGLRVFAATFTGLVGAMVILAVARSRRPRLPLPVPSFLVTGAVAAAIATTVIFLRREPDAAGHLPPGAAVLLATVLAGCLGVAVAAPRRPGTARLASRLGVAAAVVFTAWFLLAIRSDGTRPPLPLVLLLALVLPLAPVAAFVVPAFTAARAGRSFRSGLRAAVWTVAATVPMTYALWLPEALRRHAIDGRLLVGDRAPVGRNLTDALIFCLGVFPVVGLTLAVLGAGLGARAARGRG